MFSDYHIYSYYTCYNEQKCYTNIDFRTCSQCSLNNVLSNWFLSHCYHVKILSCVEVNNFNSFVFSTLVNFFKDMSIITTNVRSLLWKLCIRSRVITFLTPSPVSVLCSLSLLWRLSEPCGTCGDSCGRGVWPQCLGQTRLDTTLSGRLQWRDWSVC